MQVIIDVSIVITAIYGAFEIGSFIGNNLNDSRKNSIRIELGNLKHSLASISDSLANEKNNLSDWRDNHLHKIQFDDDSSMTPLLIANYSTGKPIPSKSTFRTGVFDINTKARVGDSLIVKIIYENTCKDTSFNTRATLAIAYDVNSNKWNFISLICLGNQIIRSDTAYVKIIGHGNLEFFSNSTTIEQDGKQKNINNDIFMGKYGIRLGDIAPKSIGNITYYLRIRP